MLLSIIIPCYNERNTIEKIVEKILANNDFRKEIIIIDDFSSDGTIEITKKKTIKVKLTKYYLMKKIMEKAIH